MPSSVSRRPRLCGAGSPGGLTKREIVMLRQIAGGATNRQVAEQIFISEKTGRGHLANIYANPGVFAHRRGAWAHHSNVLA